jgi:hypothetical protein
VLGRKPLLTLRDAAVYITKLPRAEHNAEEWQAAIEALMLVVELRGPTMFARIGVMKALNRDTFGSLTYLARNPTGDAASWREIDENRLDLRRYKETGRRP